MTESRSHHIVVLISGTGTNLQALIDATSSQPRRLNAKITHVVANLSQKARPGLSRAEQAGIGTTVRTLKSYKDKVPSTYANEMHARECYDADLARHILDLPGGTELVVCAGWMHILSRA